MNHNTIARQPARRTSAPRRGGRPFAARTNHPRPAAPPPALALPLAPHDATPRPFASLALDSRLARAVEGLGFAQTTPVQSAVFPAVVEGTDLVACAQTGTGKTVAFLLPILQRLLTTPPPAEPRRRRSRVLVLAPTRELVVQIEDDVRTLVAHTRISGVSVYGGVGSGPQARALRAGVDIVIATPGRLLDHINNRTPDFSGLEVLVLDEADRMLDMGFWPDVRRIVSTLPVDRQTLLFSATTSQDVVKAAAQIMREPKLIQIGRTGGLATTITHLSHVMPADAKANWVERFLRETPGHHIVFMRTKHRADRLVKRLIAGGHRCAALHANRSQSQRIAAVEGFRAGRFKALVATDIAARGIDIEGVGHVINFEVPPTADAYVHRVGRTGRAESAGTAVTLVAPDEVGTLRSIERALNLRLTLRASA